MILKQKKIIRGTFFPANEKPNSQTTWEDWLCCVLYLVSKLWRWLGNSFLDNNVHKIFHKNFSQLFIKLQWTWPNRTTQLSSLTCRRKELEQMKTSQGFHFHQNDIKWLVNFFSPTFRHVSLRRHDSIRQIKFFLKFLVLCRIAFIRHLHRHHHW